MLSGASHPTVVGFLSQPQQFGPKVQLNHLDAFQAKVDSHWREDPLGNPGLNHSLKKCLGVDSRGKSEVLEAFNPFLVTFPQQGSLVCVFCKWEKNCWVRVCREEARWRRLNTPIYLPLLSQLCFSPASFAGTQFRQPLWCFISMSLKIGNVVTCAKN